MNKQFLVIGIFILLIIGFSGCTEQNELSSTSDANNDIIIETDTDGDGVPDDIDACPYDPTQWADRDNDGFCDNPNGINPDAFPDNPTEWKDSDNDNIGDNADIYDMGNGGIKVAIKSFQCDEWTDELNVLYPVPVDPYFVIKIKVYDRDINENVIVSEEKSETFYDRVSLSYPFYSIIDVKDDIGEIIVRIEAWDEDIDTDDIIDLNGESTELFVAYTHFDPKIDSYISDTSDGRSDYKDELDGWIEYYIQIVGI